MPEVAYADDVVLLAKSIAALQTMRLEVEQVFATVGLTLKQISRVLLRARGKTLELSGHVVKWYPRLTFLGTVITLCGNDDEAIRARMTRALRTFQNPCGSTCGCISHLSLVVILLAGSELDTHKETIQLHWQLVCSAITRVRRCPTQRRKEILDNTPCSM